MPNRKYTDFIDGKSGRTQWNGFDAAYYPVDAKGYQNAIINWACKKGRSAIFADCGLGKTLIQLAWARNVADHTGGKVLILAPITVINQTKSESEKFNIRMDGIDVINYEKMHRIEPGDYTGVVLDESSILKNFTGRMRQSLCDSFIATPYKMACTATPSPNDYMELGNHSEFLGITPYVEMLATYFIHDGGETSKWRLKGHGALKFWQWLCTWAVFIRKPSDIGFDGDDFQLPPLIHHHHCIRDLTLPTDGLIALPALGLKDRIHIRRDSISERVDKVKEIAENIDGQCVIWCELNDEADALKSALNAVEIRGNDKEEYKADTVSKFANGDFRLIITKPDIAAFGVNWQQCNNIIFSSITDSFERTYQAIRRCWRYGQKNAVNVHFVYTERQQSVIDNLKRKEKDMDSMAESMAKVTKDIISIELHGGETDDADYRENIIRGDGFTAYLGDCVDGVSRLPDNSIGYSIFSPPFASLYTYSNSNRDMGNCRTHDEFYAHFEFLVKDLHRVIAPGRLLSFHCMNLPTSKQNDGFIGIRDFRGELIKMFTDAGFIYHSEAVIWKDPVTAMQRTKALGLLHKQIKKDSAMSRQGIPDYLVTMRKPGKNANPITNTNESFPVDLWQRYASPVWMDINPSDTLQFREARESDDERHICPLQIQVIERAMKLWSKPGDTVLSPFMGIGSEGYVALKMGRRFVGYELKESYYNLAVRNLETATSQLDMFGSGAGEP